MRVDVRALASYEPDERDAKPLGELDRKRAGRRDRQKDRRAEHDRFLHELVADPARHGDDVIGGGEPFLERPADQLVERVVAPDVLARGDERAGGREQARGVKPTGVGEHRLRRAQLVGQPGQDVVRDRRVGSDLARTQLEIGDRDPAAHAAGRGAEQAAPGERGGRDIELDGVRVDLRERPGGHRLGVEQTAHELEIVARGPHDRRNRRPTRAQLQRRLDHDAIADPRAARRHQGARSRPRGSGSPRLRGCPSCSDRTRAAMERPMPGVRGMISQHRTEFWIDGSIDSRPFTASRRTYRR